MRAATTFLMALLLAAAPAHAQWLKQPTRGIPRTRDGKPNLKAKAPRVNGHPDLSGLWAADPEGYAYNVTADLKPGEVLPWADGIYRQRLLTYAKDHPAMRCLPDIGPYASWGMFKVVQTRDVTVLMPEAGPARQIHTDGRTLPKDPQPTWLGYSVGRWEGDTFVVESNGFNDRTWLDYGGHPHSEELRVTERYHRTNFGTMAISITFEDPKGYAHPWTISYEAGYVPDTELLEYVCNENEKSSARMVASAEQLTTLPAALLQSYAGDYDVTMPNGKKQGFTITVVGDALSMKPEGGAAYQALSLSETRFTAGSTSVEFIPNGASGTEFVIYTVEGEMRGARKPPAGDSKPKAAGP